jgi:DNA-binding GntR family transcriptional regulator
VKTILRPDAEFARGVMEAHECIYSALVNRDPERASSETTKDVSKVEEGLARLSKDQRILD